MSKEAAAKKATMTTADIEVIDDMMARIKELPDATTDARPIPLNHHKLTALSALDNAQASLATLIKLSRD